MYAMVGTRPDIAFAMSTLAKYANKATEKHLRIARRVVAYLRTTATHHITYPRGSGTLTLTGYCDSDWGSDKTDRRSTTGYVFQIGGAPISWTSKKQKTTALSSTEAEYMAATQATKEAIYLRRLLKDLGHEQTSPTVIREDNQGTIAIARNPCHHERTKHIDIQYHFTREKIESGDIMLEYCQTEDQVADIMTKALTKDKFVRLLKMMGLQSSP